jgi:quinol monooxygenase YgiN
MFAVVHTFECKPGKKFELVMLWNSAILPELAKQNGCTGGLLLVDPDSNKCTGIEVWESDVAASSFDTTGSSKKLMDKLMPVVVTPPERTQMHVMAQNALKA